MKYYFGDISFELEIDNKRINEYLSSLSKSELISIILGNDIDLTEELTEFFKDEAYEMFKSQKLDLCFPYASIGMSESDFL